MLNTTTVFELTAKAKFIAPAPPAGGGSRDNEVWFPCSNCHPSDPDPGKQLSWAEEPGWPLI